MQPASDSAGARIQVASITENGRSSVAEIPATVQPASDSAGARIQVASITENEGGSNYAYRCSKIAANMASKSMSIDLQDRGITSTILHPGYVRTDMTKGNGLIDVDESVTGMLQVLESDVKLNGEWYHTSGRHLPW